MCCGVHRCVLRLLLHDIAGIVFWIGDGREVERFTFQQFSDAFVPHEELDVLQVLHSLSL